MKSHIPPATAAPLCPAGHLPHKEGDRLGARSTNHISISAKRKFSDRATIGPLVISLLVGEMPGRAEGGNSTRKANNSPGTAGISASKDKTR
jgi:hypothetical protein